MFMKMCICCCTMSFLYSMLMRNKCSAVDKVCVAVITDDHKVSLEPYER